MAPLILTLSLSHSVLVDETASETVFSVCFSPDGELLATGARDGVVRVSSRTPMLAIIIAVIVFKANAQHRTTSGALGLGHRQEANLPQIPGSHQGDLLDNFLVGQEISRLWVW